MCTKKTHNRYFKFSYNPQQHISVRKQISWYHPREVRQRTEPGHNAEVNSSAHSHNFTANRTWSDSSIL
ncbi:unnamed protein product [Ixodes persulcatus]